MPKIIEDQVWAGSEASLQSVLNAQDVSPAQLQAWSAQHDEDEDDETPRLLSVDEDGLATINIKGPLVNSDSWINAYVGITGYPEIRDAVIAAAQDATVQHIVLDIDSGGGAVSGVSDVGKLIRMVNDNFKPVTAFTDGNMMSAAYWLGSSAGKVYASEGAGVGSIGVIATHKENSKQLAANGVGVTVVRAGKYKALANSVEPLSAEGKAQIQAAVDSNYKIFVNHISAMRGKSYEFTDSVMAQGREFYGQAAADAGLVEGIKSYDEVASKIKQNFVDTSISKTYTPGKQATGLRVETHGDVVMAKKTFSEREIAALAAGVTLDADASSVAVAASTDDVVAEPVVEATVVETEVEAQAETPAVEVDASNGTIKLLSEQLKAAQDDLLTARLELARTQDKQAELAAVVGPLSEIAGKAINNMRVALNGSPMDMSASSPATILAEHTAMAANFAAKFKVGGVAAVTADVEVKSTQKMDALTQARLNAVRF